MPKESRSPRQFKLHSLSFAYSNFGSLWLKKVYRAMPSSLSLGASIGERHWVRKSCFQIGFYHNSLSQTFYSLCPAQARAYSDLLSTTVIGLGFPDPLSSGLPFRDTYSKSRKAMPVVELATIATTFVSRGPLPLG